MNKSFYKRAAWPIIALTILLTIPMGLAAIGALNKNKSNSVKQWLPKEFAATKVYDWFKDHFSSDEILVIRWPDCNLDDPRLAEYSAKLREATAEDNEGKITKLYKTVRTGPETIDEIIAETAASKLEVPREEVIERLKESLIGKDGFSTCAVGYVSEFGKSRRNEAVQAAREIAYEMGIGEEELTIAGPTIDSVVVDEVSEAGLYELATISSLIVIFVAWFCLRSVKLTAFVWSSAMLAQIFAIGMVGVWGSSMNAVLMMMPTLIYVLGISGAIHLVNYYLDVVREGGYEHPEMEAIRRGWVPCLLAATTTSVGLASLAISQVVPVADFGFYSAVGTMMTLYFLFLLLPAMLALSPVKPENVKKTTPTKENKVNIAHRFIDWVPVFIGRNHRAITTVCLMLIGLFAVGVMQIETTVKLQNLFFPDSPVIKHYTSIEKEIGPLIPIEIIVRFDGDNPQVKNENEAEEPLKPFTAYDKLLLLQDIQEKLNGMEYVGGSMSAMTFAPAFPDPEIQQGLKLTLKKNMLKRYLRKPESSELFEQSGFVKIVKDESNPDLQAEQLWRISARVEAMNDLDYSKFIEKIKTEVGLVVTDATAKAEEAGQDIAINDVVYTGAMPLLYEAQNRLLDDLITSFVTAFLLIAVVMVVVLRNPLAGMISMIPNVFPAVVIFGVMGLNHSLVDIGAMMTASVALGIAVDDTLHYLIWYRRFLKGGRARKATIRLTHNHCAMAMIQTSMICGIGMLPMVFSGFVPTSRFSLMMATLLFAALIGDLILLPSILSGPVGRLFFKRAQKRVGELEVPESRPSSTRSDSVDSQADPSLEADAE